MTQDDTCLSPLQIPGLTWVEITYSRPYSSECWQLARNLVAGVESPNFEEMGCGGTFVFVGDVISMAFSIRLTAYRPRWLLSFGAYLPNDLEKIFVCTFHVSLALALLNSLPVRLRVLVWLSYLNEFPIFWLSFPYHYVCPSSCMKIMLVM